MSNTLELNSQNHLSSESKKSTHSFKRFLFMFQVEK